MQQANKETPCADRPLQIVHLGLGAFHRAHQAVYLQRLLESGDAGWRLVGGNLRGDMADTLSALARQGNGYTLETVSPRGERRSETIHAISRVIPYEPGIGGLVAAGADPATRIVSFTVTEAGYYLDDAHRLDAAAHEDLRSDLSDGSRRTLYGALEAILQARMETEAGPVTLLSCDNLRSNGDRVRAGLADFLRLRGNGRLLGWVEANTAFPNGMVDRITPRPTPDIAPRVEAATGWADQAPVMAESFIQWVIEDRFAHGRPAWEAVGVEMVASVLPYEEAKIRILNSSHSCIAWAGTLLGMRHIHEGAAHPAVRALAFDYVTRAVIPCLDRPPGSCPLDLAAYRDVVLERFGNPHLRDTNQRVAMDGFSKVPGFILPTLRELLARGEPVDSVAVLPALFLAFLARWHQGRLGFDYQDQAMDPAAARAICEAADPVAAFCADGSLWGPLAGDPGLVEALRQASRKVGRFLKEHGR